MGEAKLEPDAIFSYNACISACGKGEQWQRALSLLSELREAKLQPSVVSYSAGISACGKGKQWQLAFALLSQMGEASLNPNVNSFNAALSACRKSEQRHHVRALLGAMREATVKPDVISYNAGISACEAGEQWQLALWLLLDMPGARVEPNVSQLQRRDQRLREEPAVAVGFGAARRDAGDEAGAQRYIYSAGVSACEKCEQWQRALALLSEMRKAKLELNVILTTALGSARVRRAGSGSRRFLCSVRCRRRIWSRMWSAITLP
ncbi:unnamed protein product [Prorocentrum cordatum]|uniref:Pentacotripeptide-repeat region of PRORP domain-containing protein n=1 Tax=Prorocentrum cordatum TaxID=2364126 RepID=A0ABN9PKH4_9DINO|nr:unnamed protein product [Polarella glacialis]